VIQGFITGFLILAFLGGTAWLWSGKRRATLDAAASLPLEDEAPAPARINDNR
jgi:cbb3-type cytochrome oxidase subunit 3